MQPKIESYTREYIKKTNNHLYIAPIEALKDVVAHYTITFINENYSIPKESVLNLIPDVSGCFVMQFNETTSITVWGPTTKVVTVTNDLNTTNCRFFVEFLPGGLYQVLGMPLREYLDQKLDLKEIHKTLNEEIQHKIQALQTFDELVDMMNEVLNKEVKKHKMPPIFQEIIQKVSKDVVDQNNTILKENYYLSSRQLSRYFNRYIGMSMKRFAKIVRINHLIQELQEKELLDLAYDYNYFDQAHLNHVFKEICETTPKTYIKNLSDFYNEFYKF